MHRLLGTYVTSHFPIPASMKDTQSTISLTIQIYRISYLILSRECSINLWQSCATQIRLTNSLPNCKAWGWVTARSWGFVRVHISASWPRSCSSRGARAEDPAGIPGASHFHPTAPTGGLLSGAPHGTDGYSVSSVSPSPTGSVSWLALHVCFTPHWTILHFSLHVSWHRLLENPRLKSDWFVSSITYQCDLFLIYLTSADVHNT